VKQADLFDRIAADEENATKEMDFVVGEIVALLDAFNGEESVKELFWGLLSYDRERRPLPPRMIPEAIAPHVESLEVFAWSPAMSVLCARCKKRPNRYDLERLCRRLNRRLSYSVLLLHETGTESWTLVYPDETDKNLLRFLPIPGLEGKRLQTARALAALDAVGPDDIEPLTALEMADALETYFPGALPRMWDPDNLDIYVEEVRPALQGVGEYVQEIAAYPLLTGPQERGEDLTGAESPPDGCEMDYRRWRLVVYNLRLPVWIALRVPCRGMELADLIQEGNIGLMIAARKYDLGRGTRFVTYAYYWVRQRMLRALQDSCNLIRWPSYRVADLVGANKNGRADSLSPGERQVEQLDENADSLTIPFESLDNPVFVALQHDLHEAIVQALSSLSPRQRFIVDRHFGITAAKCTLEELADELNLTRERVRQIERQALRRLKPLLVKAGWSTGGTKRESDSRRTQ